MVIIRRAAAADAEELARLRYEFRTSLRPAVESESTFIERTARWMADRLADDRWLAWVAARDDRLIGHVWLCLIEKIPNPGPEDEHYGYITNFYVQPRARNAGVGTRLLTAALDYCRAGRIDSVILWPTAASIPLYLRHGFTTAEQVMLRVVGRSARARRGAARLAQAH